MAQLPQISRDVLQTIFRTPESMRAYEELQRALRTAPDDIVTLQELVDAARFEAEAGIARAAQALQAAQRPPRGGVGIDVVQDAAGAIISVAVEELISGILPYLPRAPQPVLPRADDASFILAGQVFGAR